MTWRIIDPIVVVRNQHRYAICRCSSCGKERLTSMSDAGRTSCAACAKRKYPPISTGMTFGQWTVIEKAPSRPRIKGPALHYWKCRCRCKRVVEVRELSLNRGTSTSCKACSTWKASMARQEQDEART